MTELGDFEGMCRAIAAKYFAPGFDREDLVQEARIGAFKGLRDFRGEPANLAPFVRMCVERQVITAVKMATRGKHGPLNDSIRWLRDEDGDVVDVVDLLAAASHSDPADRIEIRERLTAVGTAIRERLSDLECACVLGRLNGESYVEIAERHYLTEGQVDRALTRAAWKLGDNGPPSRPEAGRTRRNGAHGYTCPGCGQATVKKPGRGRPPRCVVCRMREARRRGTPLALELAA